MTLPLAVYRGAARAFHAFAPKLLQDRVAKGKEDPARFMERLGQTTQARPDIPVVWIHGVSVGESLSAIPILERLRTDRPDLGLLITTATTTSAEILSRRLPEGVIHQYAPIDTPQAVESFLDHWRPRLAIFIESDIWPNLLQGLTQRRVPHALLSARITEKTYRGWQTFRRSMTELLKGYALVMAQDDASEARLRAMQVTPGAQANLKTVGAPLSVNAKELANLRDAIAGRRTIVAASTHYGEDNVVVRALESQIRGGDLLILVPRHPIKASEIRLDMEALGFTVAQRSQGGAITAETQIYLADTLGELGLFFSLADLVVMGGSFLSGIGGHNPLEAARLGKSVITGDDISNWEGIFGTLLTAGGGWRVQGPDELAFLSGELLRAPEAIAEANARALEVSRIEAGTLDRVWQALLPLLPEGA
ncbi:MULTISPECIES: 3-deoxy-D-manno-octulosonic acid transferase [Asticcacaulis]|uniref:3-deoxy-D-manno-octulosonic acid transferase n=1 Tax=Asticcacaulis TaxID=76890 RepID=UPI001AE60A32|nr:MULTISPECIES: 3-deoxy-D-manno-octulosonic acid transferase [Asticcacaulis]MBP2160640.1 3-deoxy-D-manno-octulosonic-acid transferase [Asticcacaulis solisilvae]MDR6801685.1 3-deoxy-D-manno-octulosonic-acid transferase [Asticcacaulis sp. BE141]